jgi:Lanthionine synthetase C-like protein
VSSDVTVTFSLFLWLSIVPSLQAAPDLTYLNIAARAANWILSREVDENSKNGCWPSPADLPIEEKCDLYYGNAGTLLFLHELNRAAGNEEYAEAMQRGVRFLDEHLPDVKLYGLYDGVVGIAFSLSQLSDNPDASAVSSKAIDDLIAGAANYLNSIASSNAQTRCLLPHELPDQNDLFYLGWCHGPAGTDRFFYELFAIRIGNYLRSRAQADSGGLKWIQAENRIEPDNLLAQTGLMQGAAGVGLYFIHLAELDGSIEPANRFPDSPW